MSLPGIILAAGLSSRMGQPKALLPLGESTFLLHLIETFRTTCHPLIVVLGKDAEAITSTLPETPDVIAVVNGNYELGMLSSLQVGLEAVSFEATGVIFTLVDHPRLQAATLRAVAVAFKQTGASVVIPRYRKQRGHPVAISANVAKLLLRAPRASSPKDVIGGQRENTVFVDADDSAIVEDIDTPADYRGITQPNDN